MATMNWAKEVLSSSLSHIKRIWPTQRTYVGDPLDLGIVKHDFILVLSNLDAEEILLRPPLDGWTL